MALLGGTATALTYVAGMVLGIVVANTVSDALPGHMSASARTMLSALTAIGGLVAAGSGCVIVLSGVQSRDGAIGLACWSPGRRRALHNGDRALFVSGAGAALAGGGVIGHALALDRKGRQAMQDERSS
jgi:hypothetical protein